MLCVSETPAVTLSQVKMIRTGGSIPIVLDFSQLLGVDSLLLGWGLDNDNPHSPNEKFCLADFHRGMGITS